MGLAAIVSALLIKCLIDVNIAVELARNGRKNWLRKRPKRFQNETQNEERVTLKEGTCLPPNETPAVTRPKWDSMAKAWTLQKKWKRQSKLFHSFLHTTVPFSSSFYSSLVIFKILDIFIVIKYYKLL